MNNAQAPTILVINDDEIGRYAMSRILRQAGFNVREASTGTEGLELTETQPDLVLLDVQLPDISGFEVSQRIKLNPQTAHIPVLHVSATFVDSESQVRGLESGANGYLTYPLEPTVLIATVRAHLRLRESEAQRQELALLLQDVNDAIIVTSPDLTIRHWNRGAERVYGWAESDAVGQNLAQLVGANDLPGELEGILNDLHEFGRWEGEVHHRNRAGNDVYVLSSQTLAKSFGQGDERIVIVNRDISELRKVEVERAQLVQELKEVNAELEERVAERTQELINSNRDLTSRTDELEALAYSISHDVRAPLRGIDGFSMILKEDYGEQLGETGREYLERVAGAARLMGDLIDHLLALSRLSRRGTSAARVNLTALAREAMDEIRNDFPDRRIEFSIEEGLSAVGDDDLLRTLLRHLLDNAVKFTAPRDVARIEVGAKETDNKAAFFVKDNGVGFDMRYSDKLFTAFQHLHPNAELQGPGVGLATVKRVVHRHGGRVWAESSPEEGAIFWFTLPNPPDAEPEAGQSDVLTASEE